MKVAELAAIKVGLVLARPDPRQAKAVARSQAKALVRMLSEGLDGQGLIHDVIDLSHNCRTKPGQGLVGIQGLATATVTSDWP